jgi:hypothetical protein
MVCSLLFFVRKSPGGNGIVTSDEKDRLLNVIKHPNSPHDEILWAFARLHTALQDTDFTEAVNALCEHHPRIAKDRLAGMPERFIPKDFSLAVDGYIP